MPNVKHLARVGDLADVRGHPFIHIIGTGSSNVPELAIVGNLAPAHIVRCGAPSFADFADFAN